MPPTVPRVTLRAPMPAVGRAKPASGAHGCSGRSKEKARAGFTTEKVPGTAAAAAAAAVAASTTFKVVSVSFRTRLHRFLTLCEALVWP